MAHECERHASQLITMSAPTSYHTNQIVQRLNSGYAACTTSLQQLSLNLASPDAACLQLRESRLRKAGIAGRARMASELRDMDEDVSSLSRTLAVRTLQLEMEYIFSCLEDEALDVAQDLKGAGYLLLR